jgi:SAM-dependent methyltransferase
MNQTFGSTYAHAYDLLYLDKDYTAECDLIEDIFHRYGDKSISRVLDLGCGTGNYAFPLASRGYEVVGIERSESMLAQAQNKLAHAPTKSKLFYHAGDIRSIKLESEFDAALMMFAVLGYQLENKDVVAALKTARQHVRTGALFIYDVWYGPAVLHQRPSECSRVIPTADGTILRIASGQLDISRHLCAVHFHLWQMSGKLILSETKETHFMRYFFPLELDLLLECTGFSSLRLGAFPEFDRDPDETTWNILGVGQAI